MIIREKNLKEIRPFYDSDLIKIITGVRRCGKSVILETIKQELHENGGNVIYLNFEDRLDREKAGSVDEIINHVLANGDKERKNYVLLDEVQLIDGWADAVKTLRLRGFSVFISGSNSKLLSKEFATELSGRYVSFRIRPFVYKEIAEYSGQLNKEISVQNYLVWGGFPKRIEMDGEEDLRRYLLDLEDTIVIKDLIQRYGIKKEAIFKRIVYFVLRSNARIFSARSVFKAIKQEEEEISANTVLKYLNYLKEAFVLDEIPFYSTKVKRELSYYSKIYDCDVAFNSLHVKDNRYDLDHNLENVVYNELLFRGYELKVFENKGKEIDFLANKDGKNYLIQAAYSVVDEKAYEREFGAFNGMDNSMQKILITNDEFDYSTSTVRHIRLKDFLSSEDL